MDKAGSNEEDGGVESAHTVYVVDDDPSVLKALERLLETAGYSVELFESPAAFQQIHPPDHPCCLVLDVRLPGINGLELHSQLDRWGREVPVVFISGHGDIPMSVRAMKAGAVDFLPKPFNDEDLLQAVEIALGRDEESIRLNRERSRIEERLSRLTPREREVLEWVITGMLNKQIAWELGASEKTIKVHRGRVMRKMEADSVPDLVRMVQQVGIHGPAEEPEQDPEG